MAKRHEIRNSTAEFLIFQLENKEQGIEVMYAEETIWCTQKAMAALFDVGVPAISKHLANIFETGELKEDATISKMETVQLESNCEVRHLGYRHVAPVCHTQLCAHIILRKKSLFIVLSPQMLNELSSNDMETTHKRPRQRASFTPNETTLAEMRETLSGQYAGVIDTSTTENFISSIL